MPGDDFHTFLDNVDKGRGDKATVSTTEYFIISGIALQSPINYKLLDYF